MRSTIIAVSALVSLVAVMPVAAQTERPLLVGARVRITMSDTTPPDGSSASGRPVIVIGQLLAIGDSTLSIRKDVSADETIVPRSRVQRLEVSTGSNRSRTAAAGGLIGLAFGGILGYASGKECQAEDFICFSRDETTAAGAFAGAAVGGLVGLLVGQGERWQDAAAPSRLSVIPTGRRSMRISSTLRF